MMTRLVLSIIALHAMAFSVPPNDGFVTDAVGVLLSGEEQHLESVLRAYKEETTNEIAVLIVESLDGASIADTGFDVGREWGVGSKGFNNGILILMSYADREVFIATGYGLEGAVPDIVAKGIIDRDMTPYFRDGKYLDGLIVGVEALQKHIGGEYTAERYAKAQGGSLISPFIATLIVCSLFLIVVFVFWIQSRAPRKRRKGNAWIVGGGGFGGGNGGGGGFGGGSFGGGGAGGRW